MWKPNKKLIAKSSPKQVVAPIPRSNPMFGGTCFC